MKTLVSAFAIALLFATAPATAADCVDLSHVMEFDDHETRVRQLGCDRLVTELYSKGKLLSSRESEISPDWITHRTERFGEVTTTSTQLKWNPQRTGLSRRLRTRSLDKSTGVIERRSQIETFQIAHGKVLRSFTGSASRTEKDGRTTHRILPSTYRYFPRLP